SPNNKKPSPKNSPNANLTTSQPKNSSASIPCSARKFRRPAPQPSSSRKNQPTSPNPNIPTSGSWPLPTPTQKQTLTPAPCHLTIPLRTRAAPTRRTIHPIRTRLVSLPPPHSTLDLLSILNPKSPILPTQNCKENCKQTVNFSPYPYGTQNS